jgi:hypothetical protein
MEDNIGVSPTQPKDWMAAFFCERKRVVSIRILGGDIRFGCPTDNVIAFPTADPPAPEGNGNGADLDLNGNGGDPVESDPLLTPVRRDMALAQGPVAKLAALAKGAQSLAAPVRYGLRERADVVDSLIEQAGNVGLIEAVSLRVVEDTIARGLDHVELVEEPPPQPEEPPPPDFEATKPARIKTGPGVSMEGLQPMTFEPIKYVVPGVIVEGLTLLAGKPKIGKSWLLLHAGVAVASGGFTLGDIHCIEGDVLYLALEDNLRRVQARMTKLFGITRKWPSRMIVHCEWPRLIDGGLDPIREWAVKAKHPRLVIIDTLAMVRPPLKLKDQTQYAADYAAVLELRKLAAERGIAIAVVHHLRKEGADDALDTVSGTLGLTGAVDTVIVLRREASGIVMHGRGRDLIDVEKAMTFDKESCLWRIAGDAATVRMTTERATILQAIEDAGEPVGPGEIADATGMRSQNVRFLLGKLLKEGAVKKAGYGKYRPADGSATNGGSVSSESATV